MWPGLTSAWRQAWELISGPSPAAETRQVSFNRMQSRVITGLLTWHNTLRRHLSIAGLIENSLCKRWGAEEKISAHVLCENETLAIFRHTTWVPFSWTLRMIEVLRLRAIWNFIKGTRLPGLWQQSEAHQGICHRGTCIGTIKGSDPLSQPILQQINWPANMFRLFYTARKLRLNDSMFGSSGQPPTLSLLLAS